MCPTTPFFYYKDNRTNQCVKSKYYIIQHAFILYSHKDQVKAALHNAHMASIRTWEA